MLIALLLLMCTLDLRSLLILLWTNSYQPNWIHFSGFLSACFSLSEFLIHSFLGKYSFLVCTDQENEYLKRHQENLTLELQSLIVSVACFFDE